MARAGGGNDIQWCFSQVKGAVDDDVAEGKKSILNAVPVLSIFPPNLQWITIFTELKLNLNILA
uniref:Uncharacterized protein n=1 Tax=Spermophilus dauricus TaxID=99837 RepID=A0A8C9P239_SPEDA